MYDKNKYLQSLFQIHQSLTYNLQDHQENRKYSHHQPMHLLNGRFRTVLDLSLSQFEHSDSKTK